ncbi:MATE family efflux transporter [Terrisporobacter vanillatitrophus]|uniref:MATE family efflux transporter n=1 Tax=Terrisporobacter vanillatitrophus TaxID=3058402 RepID=UPI003368C0D3
MGNSISLKSQFKKYVIPSVAAMWVFSLYSMVDGIFVSEGVGSDALAAVNISTPYINMLFAISILFATGASTVVAIKLGSSENKKANEYFTLNLVVMVILATIIMLVSLLNLEKIAVFLGATNSTIVYVKDYVGTIMLFVLFYLASYYLEVLIKSDGYPHIATIGVIISAITNIVLDYIFVMKLGYGVKGAAFATGIARVFSFSFFFIHFLRKRGKLKFTKFRFDFTVIKKVLFIGIPDSTTELSVAVVILIFNQSILRVIGENALVSYSVVCYINTLVLTTMMGIAQGIQPICSYYYGKKDKDSVLSILKMGLKTIKISSIVSFLIVFVFAKQLVSLFLNNVDEGLFNYTVNVLRLFSPAFLIMGCNVITSGFCVAVDMPVQAGIVSLGRGVVVITITLIVMIHVFGGFGIWISTLVSELIVLVISKNVLKKSKESLEYEYIEAV